MFANRMLKMSALSLAAAVGLALSPATAGPPKGGKSGGSHHSGMSTHKPMGNHHNNHHNNHHHKPMGNHHQHHQHHGKHAFPWMQKPHHDKHVVYSKTYGDKNYCHTYGVKKSFGYCYTGFNHSHWYCRKWSSVHGCYFFYDPGCCAWYYYCQPDACYYPCSYMPYQTYCYIAPATGSATTSSFPTGSYGGQAPATQPAPMQLPPLPGE